MLASVNFSVRNGMRIFAYQPDSVTFVATSQIPSQFALFSRPSFDVCESHFAPAGFVANWYPFRSSWNVSRMMVNPSLVPVL
jgi:hypothetical protein